MLLLDTNALLSFLGNPVRFGKHTNRLLSNAQSISYSAVSVFEIAMKDMLGKARLRTPLGKLLDFLDFGGLPLSSEDVLEVYSLTGLVKHDPFDRLILATAKARGAKLITSDRKLLELGFDWVWDSSK